MSVGAAKFGLMAAAGVSLDGDWVALQSTDLGSDQATVTFTSAGSSEAWSGMQDLVVIGYFRGAGADANALCRMTFNNDTASNYYWQDLYTTGSSAIAALLSSRANIEVAFGPGDNATANMFGAFVCNIYDINATDKFTSVNCQSAGDRNGSGRAGITGGRWRSTAAVTEIDFVTHSGNIKAGSRFDLYGIKAAE